MCASNLSETAKIKKIFKFSCTSYSWNGCFGRLKVHYMYLLWLGTQELVTAHAHPFPLAGPPPQCVIFCPVRDTHHPAWTIIPWLFLPCHRSAPLQSHFKYCLQLEDLDRMPRICSEDNSYFTSTLKVDCSWPKKDAIYINVKYICILLHYPSSHYHFLEFSLNQVTWHFAISALLWKRDNYLYALVFFY